MLALDTPSKCILNTNTPINLLPPELLAGVFWSVIRDGCAFGRIRKTVYYTLTLCSVCSNWRSVILSNPSFWSYIPVVDMGHSHYLTRLCLERSKESPIDILIHLHGKSGDEDWPGQQELILHASRIRSVYVSGKSCEHVLSLLGRVLGDQLPKLLTGLSIRVRFPSDVTPGGSWNSNITYWYNSIQRNTTKICDQLHTFHLDGVSISEFRGWEGSSFSGLRELVLSSEHAYYEGMSHIMTTANNLQLLEFHGPLEWTSDPTVLKPILRPGQGSKVLRLHKVPFGTLRQGIKWIVPEAWKVEMLIETRLSQPLRALQNSSTVTALSLDNNEGPIHTGHYLRKILAALPNIHSLTIERFELVESTLSGMIRRHDGAEAEFPRLSVLRLHSSRVLDHDAFKCVIASHPIR
ncbi:hypothetical protein RSAG8_12774, partial [Rhizoctonia solani AG-8 WAC10335]